MTTELVKTTDTNTEVLTTELVKTMGINTSVLTTGLVEIPETNTVLVSGIFTSPVVKTFLVVPRFVSALLSKSWW
jgi:hypothetical protein